MEAMGTYREGGFCGGFLGGFLLVCFLGRKWSFLVPIYFHASWQTGWTGRLRAKSARRVDKIRHKVKGQCQINPPGVKINPPGWRGNPPGWRGNPPAWVAGKSAWPVAVLSALYVGVLLLHVSGRESSYLDLAEWGFTIEHVA